MSYCIFENTAGDFSRCVDKMQEALDEEKALVLNDYEVGGYEAIYGLCSEFLTLYELLQRNKLISRGS